MSTHLRILVRTAATMRARGCSWDEIAPRVQRSVKTVRDWPSKQRPLWLPAYEEGTAAPRLKPKRSEDERVFAPGEARGQTGLPVFEEAAAAPRLMSKLSHVERVFAAGEVRSEIRRSAPRNVLASAQLPSPPDRVGGTALLVAVCVCLSAAPYSRDAEVLRCRASAVGDVGHSRGDTGVSLRSEDSASRLNGLSGARFGVPPGERERENGDFCLAPSHDFQAENERSQSQILRMGPNLLRMTPGWYRNGPGLDPGWHATDREAALAGPNCAPATKGLCADERAGHNADGRSVAEQPGAAAEFCRRGTWHASDSALCMDDGRRHYMAERILNSVYEEGRKAVERHKWIESEKVGRDLGEEAILNWLRFHWPGFHRSCVLQHLEGTHFWVEFDRRYFGGLRRDMAMQPGLINPILDQIRAVREHVEILRWANDEGISQEIVGDVLEMVTPFRQTVPVYLGFVNYLLPQTDRNHLPSNAAA